MRGIGKRTWEKGSGSWISLIKKESNRIDYWGWGLGQNWKIIKRKRKQN